MVGRLGEKILPQYLLEETDYLIVTVSDLMQELFLTIIILNPENNDQSIQIDESDAEAIVSNTSYSELSLLDLDC